jgi:DNA-binding NtrC family response regulator
MFRAHTPDLVVVDHVLPDATGLALLSTLRAIDASVPCIVLTGHACVDLAVRAMKLGAADFLSKPITPTALIDMVRRLAPARAERDEETTDCLLLRGGSAAVKALRREIALVAPSACPVLITGETGTGKSTITRELHGLSARAKQPFVDVNAGGLCKELVESELFGHERGAFTGAHTAKRGLFEVADGGTLFLDEVGDLEPSIQTKLLKVIEEKRFRRMGDTRERATDVRVVTATNRDLDGMMSSGAFRADLYFRIATVTIRMPSLRDRAEDIPEIVPAMLVAMGHPHGVSDCAMDALMSHEWAGNFRELRNVLERGLLHARAGSLRAQHLALSPSRPTPTGEESGALLKNETRALLARVLSEENGNVPRAAQRLGMARSTLYLRIQQYGLSKPARAAGS